MTQPLPDPRHFAATDASPLNQAAGELVTASPDRRNPLLRELARVIAEFLERGEETVVREALRQPSSPQTSRLLQQALELALAPDRSESGVNLQLFAIPVLFVVGAPATQLVPGVISDTDAVRSLFERSGVLGHCRNFGLSNALAALKSVEAIPWAKLYSIANAQTWDGLMAPDLPPAPIDVPADRETVQLRFISGAALTSSDAPAFVEAAGNIGRWGLQLTRELGKQLAIPDVQLLAIPRAPRSIVRATREGWFAARELGFQLFLSNALRQARLRIGEPDVTISAGSDQTIRIRMTSPFDDLLDQTYGWPLTPSDDFDQIVSSIAALLEEARVARTEIVPAVEDIVDSKPATH